ncbi:UDP-glucose 4-epimerase [Cytobacillus eiseniae]|uniref:UDP-glucose 4-epimerase n=1 Tax=Cytobacillus eiseniae TaxID=762947 RepID=A0ABS4RJF5_9BACI|nr:SDR family oxidoreductase [Cytobacillus eiseniae]MBP2242918.1 UDP-glucose 4-epimerase [Cytobacillus eiseniae]
MNILITGAAGYLGSNLLERLVELNRDREEKLMIIAADIREPAVKDACVQFVHLDVRSPDMSDVMKQYSIETVVHLASIVTPGKKSNREFEYSVDVIGSENVLRACVEHRVKRFVVTSSGAAYGYYSDNAEWIKEDHPIRGNEEFAYSYHKRLVEELLATYRKEYPELEQVIFRVGTILGDSTKNQITALFEKKRVLGISDSKSPFVFIWDQDVVECLIQGIFGSKVGIFNVAGDGALTIDEIAEILGKRVLRIPAGLVAGMLFILKRLSLTQYGEEQVNFLRYRPVLDNHQLKTVFGYTPRLTSKEVFQYFLEKRKEADAVPLAKKGQ